METLLIQTKSKKTSQLLMDLSKEMGVKYKKIDDKDLEDYFIKRSIDEGRKSGYTTRDKVMNALKK
jgi:hypothetical protein